MEMVFGIMIKIISKEQLPLLGSSYSLDALCDSQHCKGFKELQQVQAGYIRRIVCPDAYLFKALFACI